MQHRYGALVANDTGAGDGQPPIVLLPGLTFDHRSWAPVVAAVRESQPERRIVALDLPGHGATPPNLPHDLPRVTELVHDALDAAGADAPVLVGHSMSGAIVSMYAARWETAAVVNVDQPPLITPFAQLVRALEPRLRAEFDATWREVFVASFHTEYLPDDARVLVESNSRPGKDLVLSYWQMLLERPIAEIEAFVSASLHEVARREVPYTLVVGSELPAPVRAQLSAAFPAMRLVEWPGSGHFPHLARPVEFAALLAGFGRERATAQVANGRAATR
jgi:pimeloyl-ACP methyl ester carboxylesterase